eukprot:492778-Rhodomonas_salina.1
MDNLDCHDSLKLEIKERTRRSVELDFLEYEVANQIQEATLESPRVMTTSRQSDDESEGEIEGMWSSRYGGLANLKTARRAHNRAVG